MAGELNHYSSWIRRQPCRACLGPGPCDPHHAQSGTTYDPDEPVPLKSAGPKRGRGQRTHDKWLISLHLRCHAQFTENRGRFKDWTKQERAVWEHDQVAELREKYAKEYPDRVGEGAAELAARSKSTAPAERMRRRIVDHLRARAGERRLKEGEAAVLSDVADEIEAMS